MVHCAGPGVETANLSLLELRTPGTIRLIYELPYERRYGTAAVNQLERIHLWVR
jgi:hypothetical protein